MKCDLIHTCSINTYNLSVHAPVHNSPLFTVLPGSDPGGGGGGGGGGLRGLKPPPPSKLMRCVTYILVKILTLI